MPELRFYKTVEVEVDDTLDFEAYCAVCGAHICHLVEGTETGTRRYPAISVTPCEDCLKTAKTEGDTKAEQQGYESGWAAALKEYNIEET